MLQHAGLMLTIGSGLAYLIGVRSVSGVARELGVTPSDMGIEFRDYAVLAIVPAIAFIAGLLSVYVIGRFLSPLLIALRPSPWPVRIGLAYCAGSLVMFLLAVVIGDHTSSDYQFDLVYQTAALCMIPSSGYFAVREGLARWQHKLMSRRASSKELNQEPTPSWADQMTASDHLISSAPWFVGFMLSLIVLYPTATLVWGTLTTWPEDWAVELESWSAGGSTSDVPDAPLALDLVFTPTVVEFELDGERLCGVRISDRVLLHEGKTLMLEAPGTQVVGTCWSVNDEWVPSP